MPCRYCLNCPRCMPAERSISATRWLISASVGRHAETLGVLDLQALVDHLAQKLRREPLLQIGCLLHAGAADGEGDALLQLEVGDRLVVDAGHHAQRLRRDDGDRSGNEEDGEQEAKKRRRHCPMEKGEIPHNSAMACCR